MHQTIISAPFGNYLSSPYATSTIGTYTFENRAGFLRWKLAKALLFRLRYVPIDTDGAKVYGWINKLGLPNPGIAYLQKKVADGYYIADKILSIHGFNTIEWQKLLHIAVQLKPEAIELNVSCPNVGELSVPTQLFTWAIQTKLKVIVKLPPKNYEEAYKRAFDSGIRSFHCCNTLPTGNGGLSGLPLKPHVLKVIKEIRQKDSFSEIIAGGGIRTLEDIKHYAEAGADRFALASIFFNPRYWVASQMNQKIRSLAYLNFYSQK